MAFIDNVLQPPAYGWSDKAGHLIVPTNRQLFTEAFSRVNILATRKNWISAISWLMAACMVPFLLVFAFRSFSLPLLGLLVLYSMVIMSTQATIWFHRYSTHKAYTFSHPVWRFITQNLVLRTFPEEIYVVSHHVHYAKLDQPGDPYNVQAGLMYCMLSDVNHQSIAKDLSEADYTKAAGFLRHTGVWINSYEAYLKWGSIASPIYTLGLWVLNWSFWYTIFFLIGGHGLACALFAGTFFWFVLVRAFNYTGHGKGQQKHVDGVDFDRRNLSLNQSRPGLFSGERHNNHHMCPGSARAGFLRFQLDLAWLYILGLYKLGAVASCHDSKKDFLQKYVLPKQVIPFSARFAAMTQHRFGGTRTGGAHQNRNHIQGDDNRTTAF